MSCKSADICGMVLRCGCGWCLVMVFHTVCSPLPVFPSALTHYTILQKKRRATRAKVNVEEESWDISSSSVCFQQSKPCRSSLRSVLTVEHSQKPQIIIGLCVLWPGEEIYWIWLSDIHGWALLMEQRDWAGLLYSKLHCNKTACWTSQRNMSKFHTFKSHWWSTLCTLMLLNSEYCGCWAIVWRMRVSHSCVICSYRTV